MNTRALSITLALLATAGGTMAQTTLIDWNQQWDFMHPMGALPAGSGATEPNSGATKWYAPAASFAATYAGPQFGAVPRLNGTAATPASFDSGRAGGPIAYGALNYTATAGAEFTAAATALTTPNTANRQTAYFRTTFTVPAGGAYSAPILRYLMDDGAFVYLDGELIAKINMGTMGDVAGPPDTYLALAANTANTEEVIREAALGLAPGEQTGADGVGVNNATILKSVPFLAAGPHTLAVSVHNQAPASSDLAMAVQLTATVADCAIFAGVANTVRSEETTPLNLTDDKVSCSLTVTGAGVVSPSGWIITGPQDSALLGKTGAYGTPQTLTAPIAEFAGPGNTLIVEVADSGEPLCTTTAVITAPGCLLTAAASNIQRQDPGATPLDPSDDTFSFNVIVNGQFGSGQWITDPSYGPGTGSWSPTVPASFTGIPVILAPYTLAFYDSLDSLCTVDAAVAPPRLIGTKNLNGTDTPLFTDGTPLSSAWLVDEYAFSLTMVDGDAAGPGLKEVRSEVMNLTGVSGALSFHAELECTDSSSGFEIGDQFTAELILNDGVNPPTTVSLITPYDPDASGLMAGAELTPAVPGPPQVSGAGSFVWALDHIIPDNIISAQFVFRGLTDSGSETLMVRSTAVTVAPPSINVLAGPVVIDNRGTPQPDDDRFTAPLTITGVNTGASPGWTSDAVPAAGNYSAVPVSFGPFPLPAGAATVVLTEKLAAGVTRSVTLTPPLPTITVSAPLNITRMENGPGPDDDTVAFDLTITGNSGGPQWSSTGLVETTGAFGNVTVTLAAPLGTSPAEVIITDISYPDATRTVMVNVPGRYTIGQKDFGAGLSDVYSAAGTVAPAVEWINDATARTLLMNNGVDANDKIVSSDVINLSSVGQVRFSANLIARDTSLGSNFETPDRFKAELIIDGVAQSLIRPAWDKGNGQNGPVNGPADGYLNGYQGVADAAGGLTAAQDYNLRRNRDEFNLRLETGETQIANHFPLSAMLPESANAVQLIVVGANIATSETFTLQDVLFVTDSDGDNMSDAYETANGLDRNSALDAGQDADRDGQSNLSEYLAGTNPRNASSGLRIQNLQLAGNALTISWSSVAGRVYQIQISPDLETPWVNLGPPAAATPDVAGVQSATATIMPGRYFLRVAIP